MAIPRMTSPFRVGQRVRIVEPGARLCGHVATIKEIRLDDLQSSLWSGTRQMQVHILDVDGIGDRHPTGQEIGAGAQHIAPVGDDSNSAAKVRSRKLSLEAA